MITKETADVIRQIEAQGETLNTLQTAIWEFVKEELVRRLSIDMASGAHGFGGLGTGRTRVTATVKLDGETISSDYCVV